MANLYDVIHSSYKDANTQRDVLGKNGYTRDDALSNHNQQVYFNPTDKKLIFSVAGTHNLTDWGTNAYLAAGKVKDTNRYKEADKTLKAAREKYSPAETTVAGHSLGGAIAGYVASKNDNVYTLDKAATIEQKVRGNEKAYRTAGDIVSAANAGATHMTTLQNNNATTGVSAVDALRAHNVSNIKNAGIFV